MLEIKVNDYVRFKNIKNNQYIGKIAEITKLNNVRTKEGFIFEKSKIVKSSPNIGKLLKVGDFIDGMPIVGIEDTTIHTLGGWFIDVEDVEDLVTSVVTKETFEQMEYKMD